MCLSPLCPHLSARDSPTHAAVSPTGWNRAASTQRHHHYKVPLCPFSFSARAPRTCSPPASSLKLILVCSCTSSIRLFIYLNWAQTVLHTHCASLLYFLTSEGGNNNGAFSSAEWWIRFGLDRWSSPHRSYCHEQMERQGQAGGSGDVCLHLQGSVAGLWDDFLGTDRVSPAVWPPGLLR